VRRRDHVVTVDDAADIPVPDSVHALIASRLDALIAELKGLLADASVVGHVFWDGAVSAIGDRDRDQVEAELREITRKELVRPAKQSSIFRNVEYSFAHGLIRDVSYRQIPRAARGHKHRATAKWIEAVAAERVTDHAELLAYHYEQAVTLAVATGEVASDELIGATRRFLILAGDRTQDLDVARAQGYYERALHLLPAVAPERADVLLKVGIAATSRGRFDEAQQRFEEALAAFIDRDQTSSAAYTMVQLSNLIWERGDPDNARAILAEAITLLEQEAPGPELASAYADRAWQALIVGRSREGLEAAAKALLLAEDIGSEEAVIRALSARGMARCDLGDARGLDDLRAALNRGLASGLARATAVVYSNMAEAVAWSAGPAAALQLLSEASDFCRLRGMVDAGQWVKVTSLEVLFALGRWDELLDSAGTILDWTNARGGSYGDLWALAAEAMVLLHRGDSDRAAALTEDLLPKGRELSDPQAVGPALVTAALIEVHSGDLAVALRLIEELESMSRAWPAWWRAQFLPDAVRVAASAGGVDLAERLVTGFAPSFAREHHALTTARAAISEAKGEQHDAAKLYAEAAAAWGNFGFVLERGLALVGHGRCLVLLGRPDADEALKGAREIFLELGAVGLIAEADSWLERSSA
jgi:tetratricopeptide (TPR) repeat protein